MKKIIILLLLTLVILIGILAFSTAQSNYVKIIPHYTHSYTKAICNSENFCQDYEIFCKNQEIIEINPITGASVQFPENWQDPRDEETINSLC